VVPWSVRYPTEANHTATHLLHAALREVLGEHVHQAGSMVRPDKLRFDFAHPQALTPEERAEVERRVNEKVFENLPVRAFVTPIDEARKLGAMMLFGEKYGATVRVVSFGSFSTELCGGTHVDHAGQIGGVAPVAEKSIGAGVRRLEFLAGDLADGYVTDRLRALERAAGLLRAAAEEVPDRVEALLSERKELQRQLDEARRRAASTDGSAAPAHTLRGRVAYQVVGNEDLGFIRHVADAILDRETEAEVAMVWGKGDDVRLVVKARQRGGVSAKDVFDRIVAVGGGRGGGSATLAQGGGFDPAKIEAMVDAAVDATGGA
jgi:alanyl-tRNA synthetase